MIFLTRYRSISGPSTIGGDWRAEIIKQVHEEVWIPLKQEILQPTRLHTSAAFFVSQISADPIILFLDLPPQLKGWWRLVWPKFSDWVFVLHQKWVGFIPFLLDECVLMFCSQSPRVHPVVPVPEVLWCPAQPTHLFVFFLVVPVHPSTKLCRKEADHGGYN